MKIDIDSMFEPIEIVMGGKPYTVTKITQGVLDKISKGADDEADESGTVPDLSQKLGEQLGIILNVEVSCFDDLDVRIKTAAVRNLTDILTKQLRGGDDQGNVSTAAASATG